MINRRVFLVAALLTILAAAIFAYKVVILELPLGPDAEIDTWNVEVRISFNGSDGPAKASLYLLQTEGHYEVIDERFISGDYGLSIRQLTTNRKAVLSSRLASGQQFLLYRATIRRLARPHELEVTKTPEVSAPELYGAELAAARNVLESVHRRSADVETLVSVLLEELGSPASDDNILLLLDRDRSVLERANLATRILALAGISARVVHGFALQRLARSAAEVHWLEVFNEGQWLRFGVANAGQDIPDNYLPWWRFDRPLASVEGGEALYTRISVTLDTLPARDSARGVSKAERSAVVGLSLLNLPIETQALYHVLLTVPIGVFLLVIMRNVVGIKTFGTFMPVLIALAFRETQLLWGIVLFILVVGLGLAVRFYFDRLKLLAVPRLASVLIVVILLMGLISIISYKLGMPRGLSVALFPMVIMTMTIERMSVVWEETGPREALQQGAGSLLVAAFAYLLMNIELLRYFVFVFPESLLLVLAMTLLLGRYSGYRLTELLRFEVLGREP